jgi:hypothetical protein
LENWSVTWWKTGSLTNLLKNRWKTGLLARSLARLPTGALVVALSRSLAGSLAGYKPAGKLAGGKPACKLVENLLVNWWKTCW